MGNGDYLFVYLCLSRILIRVWKLWKNFPYIFSDMTDDNFICLVTSEEAGFSLESMKT